jgi:hypothetical protein
MTDFRRDKESHHILVKGIIYQEDIIIVNVYAPNIGVPSFIMQALLRIMGHHFRINNSE